MSPGRERDLIIKSIYPEYPIKLQLPYPKTCRASSSLHKPYTLYLCKIHKSRFCLHDPPPPLRPSTPPPSQLHHKKNILPFVYYLYLNGSLWFLAFITAWITGWWICSTFTGCCMWSMWPYTIMALPRLHWMWTLRFIVINRWGSWW